MDYLKLSALVVFAAFGLVADLQAACKFSKSIQGEELEMGVLLSWSTQYEIDNAHFILEKSIDGQVYETIGIVQGAGNSTKNRDYSFLDIAANKERLHYRLRMVDLGGVEEVSDVFTFNKEKPNNYIVVDMSAISTASNFTFTLEALRKGDLDYQLQSVDGQVVNRFDASLNSGLNTFEVDLSALNPGIYKLLLRVEDEEEVITLKRIPSTTRGKQLATKSIVED